MRSTLTGSRLRTASISRRIAFGSVAGPWMHLRSLPHTSGKLKPQKPYERPLLPGLVRDVPCVYALQEKLFSFSGEDFSVKDT